MNHEKLNKAAKALAIQNVLQRTCSALLSPDYWPSPEDDRQMEVQYKHVVLRSEILERIATDQEDYLFRVFVDLGVRWCDSAPEDTKDSQKNPSEEGRGNSCLGTIEASYVAEYKLSDKDIDSSALDEFALNNASYHIWPYFREYVSSQCGRMDVPRITMPMVQFAKNRDQPAEDGVAKPEASDQTHE